MAVGTITPVRLRDSSGNQFVTVNDVVPTSGANYTVGGSVITAAQLGLLFVQRANCDVVTQAATVGPSDAAALPQADGSVKLKVGAAGSAAENGANADLSAALVRVTAYGY